RSPTPSPIAGRIATTRGICGSRSIPSTCRRITSTRGRPRPTTSGGDRPRTPRTTASTGPSTSRSGGATARDRSVRSERAADAGTRRHLPRGEVEQRRRDGAVDVVVLLARVERARIPRQASAQRRLGLEVLRFLAGAIERGLEIASGGLERPQTGGDLAAVAVRLIDRVGDAGVERRGLLLPRSRGGLGARCAAAGGKDEDRS